MKRKERRAFRDEFHYLSQTHLINIMYFFQFFMTEAVIQTMKPVNSKLSRHPHPQGQSGGRRKYRKCICDQDMSCTISPSSPISTKYREQDDTTMSSASSTNSTQLSTSTCTSNNYDAEFEDSCNNINSISMLNSQLMGVHGSYPHSNASRTTFQHVGNRESTRTPGNEFKDLMEDTLNNSNSRHRDGNKMTRGFGRRHPRFREKMENIDFVLRRDDNRLKHELSKEATTNHNRTLDMFMDDTDYDADYDDDGIQEELNEIIDYEQLELEERFQELEINQF